MSGPVRVVESESYCKVEVNPVMHCLDPDIRVDFVFDLSVCIVMFWILLTQQKVDDLSPFCVFECLTKQYFVIQYQHTNNYYYCSNPPLTHK